MFNLIDNAPLNAAELAEQCFALTYILSGIEHPALRESLIFVVLEKQSTLLSLLSPGAEHE
ncbi:hypothetical protein [Budvicia diplopodorum]|uniref:hypothetical protein n=1 Tax=Budvicia diplopodorum TaxID=1119056 RepID=UPI00135ADB29|nr:hypothetical protein [Budvicia diplopodorum]